MERRDAAQQFVKEDNKDATVVVYCASGARANRAKMVLHRSTGVYQRIEWRRSQGYVGISQLGAMNVLLNYSRFAATPTKLVVPTGELCLAESLDVDDMNTMM